VSAPAHALAPPIAKREHALLDFFEHEQERLARACHDMARAFARGATLVPYGTGPAATDAAHVAVEFMHPVIVGKRALPALAGRQLRGGDIAMGLMHGSRDEAVEGFLQDARGRAALTIAMCGPGARAEADHPFEVPSSDPTVVQEVQETAYHVLWELVHVFFEHPGLLDDACITCGDVAVEATVVSLRNGSAMIEKDGAREEVAVELVEDVRVGDRLLCHAGVALDKLPPEEEPRAADASDAEDPSGFLYPFLDRTEADLDAVLADVQASSAQKARDVAELRRSIDLDAVERCARDLRSRFERGGRLVAFGNGGSSTDAQDAALDCRARGRPALALNDDVATITAVGNDVGFDNVFARQLIPLARHEDVALAISTSGSSPNVVAGLEEAHRRGMLTVGVTGYDGGRLAELGWLDHLFVVGSDYIPRLQEAHATIYHLLLDAATEAA
jgi:D-sedoheptulose 7-phosphate isomerase